MGLVEGHIRSIIVIIFTICYLSCKIDFHSCPRGKVDVLAPQLCTIQSRRLEVLVTLLQRDNVIPTNLLLVELRNKGRSLLLKSSFEM